jgi:hypothetical protein
VAEPVAARAAWRLSPAFISRLPAHLRGLTVVRTWLSQVATPLAERDAVCVAPSGLHWLVRHEPSRDDAHGPKPASREVAKASHLEIKILRCDAWGRRRSENHHIAANSVLFPVGELPILEPIVAKAPEPAPTSPPVSAPAPPADPSAELLTIPPAVRRSWCLTPALLERLPEALQQLEVQQRWPSPDPGIEADVLCVAPDGSHWVVLHEDFLEAEDGEPDRQLICVARADEHGKRIPDGEFHYADPSLPADKLPVVVPAQYPFLAG